MEDRLIAGNRWRFVDLIGQAPLEVDYRILAPYAWVGKVEFEILFTLSGGNTRVEKLQANQRHNDPWVYAVHFCPPPGARFVVRLLVDGHVQLEESIDVSVPLNTKQTRHLVPHVPRLVRAINTTPVGCPGFTDDQDDPNVAVDTSRVLTILNWVWKRLSGGLDPAWLGPDGGRGLGLAEMKLDAKALKAEEWARGFSEVAVGSRYGGAESRWYFFQFNGNTTDGPSTQRMAERRDRENGRSWFPLGLACQQLGTLGLLLANYQFADFGPGLNAGGSLSRGVFNKLGGHAYPSGHSAGTPSVSIRTPRGGLESAPPVGPGTVYEFYNAPNTGGAHIAMLIRVRPNAAGWHGIQSIDTGALNVPNRSTSENFSNGNHDDPWLLNNTQIPGPFGNEPFKGVGVPYPSIPLSLSTIRRWWPLGFARLILRRKSDGKVVYATPMLRMHYRDQGFPLSLYGWSLRCRPYAAAVDCLWQIVIPQRALARSTVDAGPELTITQLLESSGIATDHPEQPLSASGPNGQRLFPFASIQVDDRDRAHLFEAGGIVNMGMTMPWGVRYRDPSAPGFGPLSDVPPYLRGDEAP